MSKAPTTPKHHAGAALVAVAACSMALTSGSAIQLLPAGTFRASDGRPLDDKGNRLPDWRLDAALAQLIIATAAARPTPYVIDYEHQTLLAKENGKPAPAAGWFHKLEWREGEGLFAVDVKWTGPAKDMIEAVEYRFISPVIVFDKATGAVMGLLMAAVTNNPAIGGMEEIMLAAASLQFSTHTTASLTQESQMDELLEQLRWMLNLPVASTVEDVLAQLAKCADLIKQGQTAEAAASCDLAVLIATQRATIASLSAAIPDPAKYVAIGTMTALQVQLAALSNELNAGRVDTLVKDALASGRLLPAMEVWARDFGSKNFAALSAYIDAAPPLAVLGGMQTSLTPPAGGTGIAALTASQAAICKAMGQDPAAFLATLNAEEAG